MCPAIPTMPPPITMPRDKNNTTAVLETFDNDDATQYRATAASEGGDPEDARFAKRLLALLACCTYRWCRIVHFSFACVI